MDNDLSRRNKDTQTLKKLYGLLLLLVWIFLYIMFVLENGSNFKDTVAIRAPAVYGQVVENVTMPERKKIIYYAGEWIVHFYGKSEFDMAEAKCPYEDCMFTSDPSYVDKADLAIFAYDQDPSQEFYSKHPSLLTACSNNESPYFARRFPHTCDITLSFDRKSDIKSYFGYFLPKNYAKRPLNANVLDQRSDSYTGLLNALSSNVSLDSVIDPSEALHFKNRSKLVAFMTSHCTTQSLREKLVEQLRKFISLDQFGSCNNNPCFKRHPRNPDCWVQVLSDYSFYLAMENSLCPDYVTEKVYMSLKYGLIPIVYGSANYSQLFPPHSFIDISKLGVKALATLLKKLYDNPEELERYHLWRGFYTVHLGGHLCEVCASVFSSEELKRRTERKNLWAEDKQSCQKPPTSFLHPWNV